MLEIFNNFKETTGFQPSLNDLGAEISESLPPVDLFSLPVTGVILQVDNFRDIETNELLRAPKPGDSISILSVANMKGRYQYCDVEVNGQKGRMCVNDKLKITPTETDSAITPRSAPSILRRISFFDSSISDTNFAVLEAYSQQEKHNNDSFNFVPEEQQSEALCAGYVSRFLSNIFGNRFPDQTFTRGLNAWEYSNALRYSKFATSAADMSPFYLMDPERSKDPEDKNAIQLNTQQPGYTEARDQYIRSSMEADSHYGLNTFHYRNTNANSNIAATPGAKPNSHITVNLGLEPHNFTAGSSGTVKTAFTNFVRRSLGSVQTSSLSILKHLTEVKIGEKAVTYDARIENFVDSAGQVARVSKGDQIQFVDVSISHFYHKNPTDNNPARKDSLVSLLASGKFEPVEVLQWNQSKVTLPEDSLNPDFVSFFIYPTSTDSDGLSINELRVLINKAYIESKNYKGDTGKATSFAEKTTNYVIKNLYENIFESKRVDEKVLPDNSPIPIINWDESSTL